jgi:hypothetical protein
MIFDLRTSAPPHLRLTQQETWHDLDWHQFQEIGDNFFVQNSTPYIESMYWIPFLRVSHVSLDLVRLR